MGLELYEVCLVFLDIFSEVACRMTACKTVGVIAVGQQEYLHIHLFLQKHVGTSQGSMHTCRIAVIEQHDIVGETVQEPYLVHTECRSRVGHHILYTALVHGDDVGVALHHVHTVFLGNGFLGLIESIELAFLVIDIAVGRVDILLVDSFRTAVEHTTSESHHLAAHAEPGEDGSSRESVEILVFSTLVGSLVLVHLEAEARCHQVFGVIAFLDSLVVQGRPAVGSKSQPELADDVITESTAAEVLHTDGPSVHIVLQDVLEVLRCPFVDDEHRLPFALLLLLLTCQFPLLDLDVIFVGQPAQRIGIGHLFQLHQEVDGVASLSTGEAMADAACGRDREGRMRIIMERAQTDIVHAAFFERHELRHHVNDVGGVHDSGYGRFVYHFISVPVSFCWPASVLRHVLRHSHHGHWPCGDKCMSCLASR